jgi:hypothetical protein
MRRVLDPQRRHSGARRAASREHNMKPSNVSSGRRLAALLSLTGVLLAGSSGYAMAGSNDSDRGQVLVGVWAIQVTPRVCATGAAAAPPINSIVTFHDGGTLSESAGGTAFAPGQRSSGHGTWTHDRQHSYLQKFAALILFDTSANLPGTPGFNPALPVTPGFFAGWQTVTHRVRIIDADHITSAGTNAFYKTDGTLYRTGCSTATAQRFE